MDQITRDDLIRYGACFDGVYSWADKHAKGLTAMPTALALRRAVGDHKEMIKRVARRNGYGDGNGNGYGDGDGYGNGYGYGDGDGNGYGYGYGDGHGYGNCYGNGDGWYRGQE